MRVLFVATRYPWPPHRGNQMRTAQWIEWLTTRHQVTLVAPRPGGAVAPAPSLPGLEVRLLRRRLSDSAWGVGEALLGGLPAQAGLYRSRELRRLLPALARTHDLGIAQLVRLALHLEDFAGPPWIADLMDSLSLNFERRAQFDGPWRAAGLRWEARRLDAAERRFVLRCERSVVVCDRDRGDFVGRLGTRAADRLRVLPLAVSARPSETDAAPKTPPSIVLTGNLGYFPTVEGIAWWLGAVWPEARRRFEGVRLRLAGARPARKLRGLARQAGAEIEESPADLRAALRGAAVAIAPARCGSGLPIKVLEAWAEGVPVIATRWTAAGAAAVADRDLLVADTAAEWLAALGRLLGAESPAPRLVAAGRQRLAADYGADRLRARLLDLVEETAALKRRAT